jgi:hypothetical protein
MSHRVLVFPASARLALFGDETTPPTIPAPEGGWGVASIGEDGSMAFGVPAEHITKALAAHLTKTLSIKQAPLTKEWTTTTSFTTKAISEVEPVKDITPIKR